jgi:YegS/Rv2252/BmrU family lipid kinase
MSLYACVIVNPQSANGATGRRWPELRAALDRVLDRWDHHFTLEPRDATRIAREAVREGYELLVSVGGDGTASEVVTGLFEEDPTRGISDRLIRDDVTLGVVRQGTGGDFARMLGLSGKLPESVAHLAGDRTRPADLGWVERTDPDGVRRASAFLNIASFGLSGLVDEKVNSTSKALGGRISFLLGAGRALLGYRPTPVRIKVDGRTLHEGPVVLCAVANGQYFGGGMRIARDAQPDDGLLDVVAQLKAGPSEVLSIGDLYSGNIVDWASVRHTRGVEVEAEALEPGARVLLDVDGEQLGTLPARFRLFPGALRLKVA